MLENPVDPGTLKLRNTPTAFFQPRIASKKVIEQFRRLAKNLGFTDTQESVSLTARFGEYFDMTFDLTNLNFDLFFSNEQFFLN